MKTKGISQHAPSNELKVHHFDLHELLLIIIIKIRRPW